MLQRIPFLRLLIALISGILIARYMPCSPGGWLIYLLLPLLLFSVFLCIKNKSHKLNVTTLLLILMLIGITRHRQFNNKPGFNNAGFYIATLLEYPVEKPNSLKTEAKLSYISNDSIITKQNEKLVIYFHPDSLSKKLAPGSIIIFENKPSFIANAGNPYEFDYKGYMANKKIYRQVYLPSGSWQGAGASQGVNLRIYSEKLRYCLLDIYRQNNIDGERFAILSALTLGYKDALAPETKQVYSSAGAMHVLAVSGLHVGIIFMAVNIILGFLRKSKNGRLLFIFLSILILWVYAFITGLSPSVLRATVMFSFVIIGDNLSKPTNIYNTLALSAFILLSFNPNLLFEVGFQLSYTAVTGIVFFQPRLFGLFSINNWFVNYAWALFTVSVAAQLSTFPLTLFYFHQFPTYFWISNFIVIPGAFLLIFMGIGVILTSPIAAISNLLATATSFLLDGTYYLLESLQGLPAPVIQNIHISNIQFAFLVLSLISLMFFISGKRHRALMISTSLLILVFGLNIYNKLNSLNNKLIYFYNASNGLLIHCIAGRENYILYENESQMKSYDRLIPENTVTNLHLKTPKIIQFDSCYQDNALFIRPPMFSFYNKNIIANPLKHEIIPDSLIDIYISKYPLQNYGSAKYINITTKSAIKATDSTLIIFCLKKDGAYMDIL